MIHTMQLFDFIKSSFKNLMNPPSLQCNSCPRQFEEKKTPKFQSINQSYQITFIIQAHFSNSP